MTKPLHPLAQATLVGFVATSDVSRTKGFYRDMLGLQLVSEDPYALVFDAGGNTLRVTTVPEPKTAEYTVLGWEVADIAAAVDTLRRAGIEFQRYEGMKQDPSGIWTAPDGSRVAWFKDPDGNTLSVSQGPSV